MRVRARMYIRTFIFIGYAYRNLNDKTVYSFTKQVEKNVKTCGIVLIFDVALRVPMG